MAPRSRKPAKPGKRVKPSKPPRHTSYGTTAERVAKLDPYLFGHIHSQTTPTDRTSLLALHLACVQAHSEFAYLEVGSHRGGSMQALIVDDRCTQIVSIDSRPEATPDDRGKLVPYEGNSTARMLEDLRAIPGADLEKLRTIEAVTADIDPASIGVEPTLSFIDGEHTHDAALQDARFCRAVMGSGGCVLFHDIDIIARAAAEFILELRKEGVNPVAYPLPDQLFAVEVPDARLYPTPPIQRIAFGDHDSMSETTRYLARSAADRGTERERVLGAWLWDGTGRTERSSVERRAGKRLGLGAIRSRLRRHRR
jgi:Methyltransferase domain